MHSSKEKDQELPPLVEVTRMKKQFCFCSFLGDVFLILSFTIYMGSLIQNSLNLDFCSFGKGVGVSFRNRIIEQTRNRNKKYIMKRNKWGRKKEKPTGNQAS